MEVFCPVARPYCFVQCIHINGTHAKYCCRLRLVLGFRPLCIRVCEYLLRPVQIEVRRTHTEQVVGTSWDFSRVVDDDDR